MTTTTTAYDAVASACDDVREGGPDDAVDGVPVGAVARPASTEQVAEVVRAAAARGLTVVPRGRGTKLTWALPPTSADVVVDLSAMDRVLDHAAGDLIVEAQAGTRLADVQATVGGAGQRLVLDETVRGASIGGTLATNASGPQRMLVGTARDLLIGITVVRADGVVARAGGRVVKNVAGYDLGKLMIGSYGTLAVVTEALFRLHPVPAVQRWVSVPVDTPDRAHQLAQAVVHGQTVPGALEVDWPAGGTGTLTVQYGGNPDGVEGRVATALSLLGAEAVVADETPAGWASYPWGAGETGVKLTFVLSGLRDVIEAAHEVGATVRGSAGTGVVHAALTDPAGLDVLRAVCGRHGGSAVVVDAPAEVKRSVDVWGPVPGLDLMRRVKDQFDAEHRLAPGRFVVSERRDLG
ncbi:MAG: FAD-binding oxidoreductase [Nocardioidaceae bacterium]|nr:FAD-binding oxidoreductase [Nocardioidaceae bacterium]NUS52764.1 FAD-binding oxidoreductase [Nocardioidaceae bacterium]